MVACDATSAAPRSPTSTTATARDRGATRAAPAFTFSAAPLGPATRRRVRGSSWHPGCPVALADLRLLRIGYWGFDRRARVGKMIVADTSVPAVRRAFAALFRARFPIRRMRLVDHSGGSDFASIEA